MTQLPTNIRRVFDRETTPTDAEHRPCAVEARHAPDRFAPSRDERFEQTQQPYVLLLHFGLVNLAAFALLIAAYLQGWVTTIVESDGTGLSIGIFAVFLGGLAVCAYKIYFVSCELGCVRNFNSCRRSWAATYLAEVDGRGSGSRAITAAALRIKLIDRIVLVRYVANSLVLLGLIGTVVLFIIALSGVDPKAASSVQAIAPMVTDLIGGMSVALYTTLVGAVLNLWLTVNYRILSGAAVRLATELIALGEANAR
jgi:hypothetical protein